jgi:methyl-accepting chemotaxis protein
MSKTAQQADVQDPRIDVNPSAGDRIDAAVRSLPRRRFFNDMPDKGLFAFVAVFGFPVIIALKLYEFDARIVAAFAVALMLGYGLIAYRLPAVQLKLDRLGDNFYYLGFIYTLASMSAALLQLTKGADIDALLGSFGIALFTTIIGVAGRVLFVQLRSEVDELEASVRRDLLGASNDLKSQLSLSLREFETFHKSVLQVAGESLVKATQIAQSEMDRIGQIAKSATDQVHEAFEKNHKSARKVDQAIEDICESAEQLTEQLETMFARLQSIITEIDRARRRSRRRWYWPF